VGVGAEIPGMLQASIAVRMDIMLSSTANLR
jgi:hypothetical protein